MHLGRFFVREFDFDRRTILEPTLGLAELDGTVATRNAHGANLERTKKTMVFWSTVTPPAMCSVGGRAVSELNLDRLAPDWAV